MGVTDQLPEFIPRITLAVAAQGGQTHLVGGVVRDVLLGIPPKDFDLEVFGIEPDRLESLLRSLHPSWMDLVGEFFGVLKLRFGESVVDVSIPRRDSKVGTGHRGFEVTSDPAMSPKEAARRRDFTVNALAMDPLTGEILDFFGGRDDLDNRILRATDTERFRDDPLRVLRAVQFAGRFGFEVEPRTVAICREMVDQPEFAALPGARITEEWRKLLLQSPKPSLGLEVGLATGAWQVLHSELSDLVDCPQDPVWHPEGDVWVHTGMVVDAAADIVRREELEGDDALAIMFGALCHDLGKPAVTRYLANKSGEVRWRSYAHEAAGVGPTRSLLSRMEFGKDVEERVIKLVAHHLAPSHMFDGGRTPTDAAVGKLARRIDPATLKELVWVAEADHRGRTLPDDGFPAGAGLLERAGRLGVSAAAPKPLLMGRHLVDLGWTPGPAFGPVLASVYEAQLEGTVTTFDQAIGMAQELKSRPRPQRAGPSLPPPGRSD